MDAGYVDPFRALITDPLTAAVVFSVCVVALLLPLTSRLRISSIPVFFLIGLITGPYTPGIVLDQAFFRQLASGGLPLLAFTCMFQWTRIDDYSSGRGRELATAAIHFLATVASIAGASWYFGIVVPDISLAPLLLATSSCAIAVELFSSAGKFQTRVIRYTRALVAVQLLAILCLSVYQNWQLSKGGLQPEGRLALSIGLAVLLVAVVLMRKQLLSPLVRYANRAEERGTMLALMALVLSGFCMLAQLAHLPALLGAAAAGIALSSTEFVNKIQAEVDYIRAIAVPIFFVVLGQNLNPVDLAENIAVVGSTLAIASIAKIAAAILAGLYFRYSLREVVFLCLVLLPLGEFAFAVADERFYAQPYQGVAIVTWVALFSFLLFPAFFLVPRTRAEPPRVFVSYSRKNTTLAAAVARALDDAGLDVKLDMRDLPAGKAWKTELAGFIDSADVLLWLVSNDSLRSTWCAWELDHASAQRKRIIPVIIEEPTGGDVPSQLSELQRYPSVGVLDIENDQAVRKLYNLVISNHDADRAHARLLERAAAWIAHDFSADVLLRGKELENAERLFATIVCAPDIVDYVEASRRAARVSA